MITTTTATPNTRPKDDTTAVITIKIHNITHTSHTNNPSLQIKLPRHLLTASLPMRLMRFCTCLKRPKQKMGGGGLMERVEVGENSSSDEITRGGCPGWSCRGW